MTPKLLIHALVTTHQDGHRCAGGEMPHFNRAGFHCATDSVVVSLPFIDSPAELFLQITQVFCLHLTAAPKAMPNSEHPLYGLRGPPSLV